MCWDKCWLILASRVLPCYSKLPTDNTPKGPCSQFQVFPIYGPISEHSYVHTHQPPARSTPLSCRDIGADTWVLKVWRSAFKTRRHFCPSSNSFSLLIKPTGLNPQLGPCSLGPQKHTRQYGWDPGGEHNLEQDHVEIYGKLKDQNNTPIRLASPDACPSSKTHFYFLAWDAWLQVAFLTLSCRLLLSPELSKWIVPLNHVHQASQVSA